MSQITKRDTYQRDMKLALIKFGTGLRDAVDHSRQVLLEGQRQAWIAFDQDMQAAWKKYQGVK